MLLASYLSGAAEAANKLPPGEPPDAPFTLPEPEGEPIVTLPVIAGAAADLASRRLLTRPEYDRLDESAKRAAFTVARMTSLDALEKVQTALVEGATHGETLAQFRARLEEAFDGSALGAAHTETVWRTNLAAAYTQGMQEVLADPLVGSEVPYVAYEAVHDSRTRPEHLAMEKYGLDGTNVYRADDPVMRTFAVPWDFNCRCALVPLTVEDAAARGVREAREWVETGRAPARPEWVRPPPFSPPEGFRGPLSDVVRL